MGVEKMYMHMGDYIFKRVRLYACAFRHFHTHAVFSLCSRSLNKCGMGLGLAQARVHAFLSVKVVK